MTTKTEGQMPWIKFNPEEWLGYCDGMSDEELGLFHRVLAKLWKTPNLTMPLATLRMQLRVQAGDDRDRLLQGLLGPALVLRDDIISIPPLAAAFEDAVKRSRNASKGGQAKASAKQPKATQPEPQPLAEEEIDF